MTIVHPLEGVAEVLLKFVVGAVIGGVDPLNYCCQLWYGSTVSRLTFGIEVHPLIEYFIFVPELIILENVEGIESSDTSHDVLSDIFLKGDRMQTCLDNRGCID